MTRLIANKELAYKMKRKSMAELIIANKDLLKNDERKKSNG
jgi:hypothetical protein